ncbi:Gfo/Idh/MocA family protein [Clostridium tyrobutyricum]|uniref:Gfo/Idh/MocA family protein n=1 Tax=Clostridium tyrobutyricum TaxID=1519 RepID=UPI002011B8E1|nr:Gfo/Idh/MocA family oxidoreductase [Clostridium tyrobutyricum]MBR9647305.1 Gfo/Idh/MocA family oxidoreductase [Clostridium tyrobutyricum]
MIRIGIICPSEIAFRRFLPAISKTDEFKYIGVAIANEDEWSGSDQLKIDEFLKHEYKKAKGFVEAYGGVIYRGYKNLIQSNDIDAIYLPLPPAIHYKWAMLALENGKHVFIEKPATTNANDTKALIKFAKKRNLALHENYMFVFHNQLEILKKMVDEKFIGHVRLYRIAFGFPRRDNRDFRYKKDLGGGALLDCGGYTIRLASMILGDTARIVYSSLSYIDEFDVDVYGSGAMINNQGDTVQISFGMDNNYKCELEIWGSKGSIYTGRVLTAPAGFEPEVVVKIGNKKAEIKRLPADDTFLKSIKKFSDCINNVNIREENYQIILKQAKYVDEFRNRLEVKK